MKAPKVHGVDLGYGLLLMIVMALGNAVSQLLPEIGHLKDQYNLFYDGSVAALLFFNGFLMSKKVFFKLDGPIVNAVRKQALVLIGLGLLLNLFGHPCTPVLLIGMCMGAGSLIARLNTQFLAFSLVIFVMISLSMVIGQNMGKNENSNILIELFTNALYKGYYGFVLWYPIYAFGMIASRIPITTHRVPSLVIGSFLVALGLFIDYRYQLSLTIDSVDPMVLLKPSQSIFYPGFVFFGAGIGLMYSGIFVPIKITPMLSTIGCVGSMRYSVLMFISIIQILSMVVWPKLTLQQVIIFNTAIWTLLIPLSMIWKQHFSIGPVENVLRYIFRDT